MSSDAQALIEQVRTTTQPTTLTPGDVVGVHVPMGAEYRVNDLERYLPTPRRPAGLCVVTDTADFVALLKRYATAATTVWADVDHRAVVAVLNDHADPEQPAWGDWRATLQMRFDHRYKAWREVHRKPMDQAMFADFIEDRLSDVTSPPAADLLEVAQTFTAKTAVDFRQAIRLGDGSVQITYHEEVSANAGRDGNLQVPAEIALSLPVFEGEAPTVVRVRLRFSVREGNLRILLIIDERDELERVRFDGALEAITKVTPVWHGTPRQ